jgi:hypothetical protein
MSLWNCRVVCDSAVTKLFEFWPKGKRCAGVRGEGSGDRKRKAEGGRGKGESKPPTTYHLQLATFPPSVQFSKRQSPLALSQFYFPKRTSFGSESSKRTSCLGGPQ